MVNVQKAHVQQFSVKTDTIFYNLFLEFPGILFELIDSDPEEAATYEFTSREIKQPSFRLDGLFLPTTEDAEKSFYLLEVQFQPDEALYYRLFGELFLYLRQYQPPHPWQVVVIYPTRRIEREQAFQFSEILALNRVTRIYIDELGETSSGSLGIEMVKLVIEDEETAPERARRLVAQAQVQIDDEATQRNLIKLIETIIVYKLPHKSREEIEAMFSLSELKQTKVYQEALEEGEQIGELKAKLVAIPRMIEFGLRLPQIAQLQDLPLEVVQQTEQLFQKQNVAAFIELLTNQRDLFSAQDLTELQQWIAPVPDRIEDLSEAIAQWCNQESHTLQRQAWRQILSDLWKATVETILKSYPTTLDLTSSPVTKEMLQQGINGE
ncbi:MAG: Rpn family recombination-promoting nuclease/putative transposase [Coleofasciculus sp. C1-SOL-03]|uniref:Rpn family recombination-promoting nuclease/putative transposase n=1 Tax=Coleofasciculus sp. C1-SOL-03 TaxID=3069522 RepID=UPI0032F1A10A